MYSIPLFLIIIDDKNATNSDAGYGYFRTNCTNKCLIRAERRFAHKPTIASSFFKIRG